MNEHTDGLLVAQQYALASVDLDQPLDVVLQEKQDKHARLSKELEASTTARSALLAESRDVLIQLLDRTQAARREYSKLEDDVIDYRDEIISPLSSKQKNDNATTRSSTSMTLVERLQSMQGRIRSLEDTHRLFGCLAKAEELGLIAKEQIKLQTPESAIETYCELVGFAHETYGLSTGEIKLQISGFVREIARDTWKELVKALEARLATTLEALAWPSKKIESHSFDYAADPKARAFKTAFTALIRLQQTGLNNPLPDSLEADSHEATSLPIAGLAQPLILRFRYHFDGKRQTNRLDKPEWYFAHILNALSDHESFIRVDAQELLKEGGVQNVDAMSEFITVLLRPLVRKIRSSVPQLLELPSLLAHTIYQALQFDSTLRESFGYTKGPGMESEWKGTADIILGNPQWSDGWKQAEKKFVDDKYFEIISAPDAWHINEDYAASSAVLRPTNSALRIRDLFDQVTDRYRPLPAFKNRSPFLVDVQLPLLDSYLQRISSATDAFETLSFGLIRAVPGSLAGGEGGAGGARLTNGVNGLQRLVRAGVSATWMEGVCKEWSEDVFFLDLWQDLREAAAVDGSIRAKCKKLLDYAASKNGLESVGIFDTFISEFHHLSERIEGLIVKHIVREITGELKSYLGRRWDNSFDAAATGNEAISTDLVAPLTIFSALLGLLATSLPPVMLNRLYRSVTAQLQELLITRSVLPKIWSEKGGHQFLFDVEYGWVAAAREATAGKVRKPENGLRKLLDAAKLVSLPTTSTPGDKVAELGGQRESIPISRVVQVAWDDTNDAAFNEILMKLGIKELVGRKDVRAILRKRPECWR